MAGSMSSHVKVGLVEVGSGEARYGEVSSCNWLHPCNWLQLRAGYTNHQFWFYIPNYCSVLVIL